jgi:hypothetical protein
MKVYRYRRYGFLLETQWVVGANPTLLFGEGSSVSRAIVRKAISLVVL